MLYKALKFQDGNSSSLLTVIFVAMRSNIEELPLMVDLCKTIGADRLVIANFVYFDVMPGALNFEKLVYHQELANEMFKQAAVRAKSCNLQIELPNFFGTLSSEDFNTEKSDGETNENLAAHCQGEETNEDLTVSSQKEVANESPVPAPSPQNDNKNKKFYPNLCPDPWATAYINIVGDILPCCAYHAPLGNLQKSSFKDIWNNFKFRDLRRRVNSRFPPLYCKDCFTFWGINAGNPDKILSQERGIYKLSTKLQRQFRKKETAIRIFQDQNIEKWIAEYDLFPGSVGPKTACYLYELIRETKPLLVFEIGAYLGFSTLHIAKALKENGFGKLVSFDLITCWAEATIHEAGLSDQVQFMQGFSDVMARQYVATVKDAKADILFIDGDHTRRGCVRDFNTLQGYVRTGGYVIFHDIYPEMCGWKGPRFVIDHLRRVRSEDAYAHFDIEEKKDLDPFGVAVCRKISQGKNPLAEGNLLTRLDIRIKTSRFLKLLERISFEVRLPSGHRDIMRGVKSIFKEVCHTQLQPILAKIKFLIITDSGEAAISACHADISHRGTEDTKEKH